MRLARRARLRGHSYNRLDRGIRDRTFAAAASWTCPTSTSPSSAIRVRQFATVARDTDNGATAVGFAARRRPSARSCLAPLPGAQPDRDRANDSSTSRCPSVAVNAIWVLVDSISPCKVLLAFLNISRNNLPQPAFEEIVPTGPGVGLGDPGQLGAPAFAEILGVLTPRISGALEIAGQLTSRARRGVLPGTATAPRGLAAGRRSRVVPRPGVARISSAPDVVGQRSVTTSAIQSAASARTWMVSAARSAPQSVKEALLWFRTFDKPETLSHNDVLPRRAPTRCSHGVEVSGVPMTHRRGQHRRNGAAPLPTDRSHDANPRRARCRSPVCAQPWSAPENHSGASLLRRGRGCRSGSGRPSHDR